MNRTLLSYAFALALLPRLAAADGIVMKPHVDGWQPAAENAQHALITHAGGIERLTVAVEVDASDAKSMVWLLPVPAPAKQVHVDVLARFPSIRGTEVYGGAAEYLGNMRIGAVVIQVWPPLVGALVYLAGSALDALLSSSDRRMEAPKAAAAAKGVEIEVHERLEKEGVVSEVITAREGSALYGYLSGKGLNLKPGAVPTLDHYIGKEYTFVASWFGAGADFGKDRDRILNRAVEIRFPAEDMFFPLFPTSAYGARVVPASIRVAGHVTPRPFADIAPHTIVGYYVSAARGVGEHGAGSLGTDLYTKIDIAAPATAFTQDLWISPTPPRQQGLGAATFVVRHPVIAFFLFLVPLSMLVSLVAGFALFREMRTGNGALRLMLAGLGNCVTLLGMLATLRYLPVGRKRRIGFLAAFSLLFMLGMAVATLQFDAMFEPMKPRTVRSGYPAYAPTPPPAVREPAAKSVDAEAMYRQALDMESGGKLSESIRIYRRAARAGNGKAAKRLGEIYEKGGAGVQRDYAESLQWYDRARRLGETVDAGIRDR